jgi:septal ring factor EnvC (AmiA/AmiB activator)
MGGSATDGTDILSANKVEAGDSGSETLYVEVRQRAEPVDPLEWFEPNEE